jgi:hypothetical protein
MAGALLRGYATAGSGAGHEADDPKFGVGHRARRDDRTWRAVHPMTEAATLIVRNQCPVKTIHISQPSAVERERSICQAK